MMTPLEFTAFCTILVAVGVFIGWQAQGFNLDKVTRKLGVTREDDGGFRSS